VRAAGHLRQELGVGDRAAVAVRLALPEVGDALAEAGLHVAVEAVVGDVELAAEEPFGVGKAPLVELRARLEPGDPLASRAFPELLERLLVDLRVRVRLRREVRRRRVAPVLEEERVDRLVARFGRHAGIFPDFRDYGVRSYGNRVSFSAPFSVTTTRSS